MLRWFAFRLKPIFTTAPAASKDDARFKSAQMWLKKQSSLFIRLNPWHTLFKLKLCEFYRIRPQGECHTSKKSSSKNVTNFTDFSIYCFISLFQEHVIIFFNSYKSGALNLFLRCTAKIIVSYIVYRLVFKKFLDTA